ncbi:helix-turn-helix domain-containing protein [Vagococcus entomophilus]|uniref:HTH cro/C1-type domain-containing protein n=1 Tax=Vagococcus entomophilus TaxID=1160095 RepID=A0A430AHM4_9ENTE|nr:helix-turn-helix transcriptional regulator [Vagococcus entomophilus]RSU07277.1 hypothetical protein CBF30_08475 [Vagococcus entomophilus]
MIRNRLSVLLAERKLKITQVANDTNLSRNTITSTAQNDGKMIQLETINVLCKYLNITPSEFFDYSPLDFEYYISIDENVVSDPSIGEPYEFRIDAFLNIFDSNNNKKTFEFTGFITDIGPISQNGENFGDALIEPISEKVITNLNKELHGLSPTLITAIQEDFTKEAEKAISEFRYTENSVKVNLFSKKLD